MSEQDDVQTAMADAHDAQKSLDQMKIFMELRGLQPNRVYTFALCGRRFLAHAGKSRAWGSSCRRIAGRGSGSTRPGSRCNAVVSWQNRRATLAENCRKGRGVIRWTASRHPQNSEIEARLQSRGCGDLGQITSRVTGMGVAFHQTGKELSMGTTPLGVAISTLVALLALGCSRTNLGLDAGGGGGGNSSGVGGSGGQKSVQYGGMSGSSGIGGVQSGGITGLGGSKAPCGCECPAIGPCSCSICDGRDSGPGGTNAFGGVSGAFGSGGAISSSGGVVSSGGISGSSGRGGVGGASGSGGSSVICDPPPCVPPVCPDGYIVAPSNDCDCSGTCGCPCGCWTCVPPSGPPDAATRMDAPGSDGPSTAGDTKVPLQHRSTSASCPSQRGPGPSCVTTSCASQPYPSGVASTCSSDSQCTSGVNGRCFPFEGMVGPGGCSYDECLSDSGCGAKTPCLCRSSSTDNSANACDVGGNCAVDSDCGPGGYCSPSMETCFSAAPEIEVQDNYAGPNPYYCHTASDLCTNDSDCASLDAGTAITSSCPRYTPCAYNAQNNRWECAQLFCCPP